MPNYSKKFKHIIPRFILIALGTSLFFFLFQWVFIIQFHLLDLKEEIFGIWVPIALPLVTLLIWMRRHNRIVRFKKDGGDAPGLMFVLEWLTIIAMLVILNNYLKTATGKYIEISNIEEIGKNKAKYIKFNEIEVDKRYGNVVSDFSRSGKYNQNLNFDIYFVFPIKPVVIENDYKYKYWCGIKYHEQVKSSLSDSQKENEYNIFYSKSANEFMEFDFRSPDYYEILGNSSDRDFFIEAAKKMENTANNIVILEPQKGFYKNINGHKFVWIFGSFGIGLFVISFALTFLKHDEKEHELQLMGFRPKTDDLIDTLNFLVPRGGHFVTSIIIDLNIFVFIFLAFEGVHIIHPKAIDLLEWGGNRRAEILDGQWWRLITNTFMHAGIMHLLLNIYGLVIAALFIEPVYGRVKFSILYLLSGIFASLASVYWFENTVSVGASGAIFGLYGALLGLLLTNLFEGDSKKSILIFVGPYVGLNLLFGFGSGIDNAAHIGGLIAGFILGLILFFIGKRK